MKLRPATDIVPFKANGNGRDEFGRYTRGHSIGGPGRPPRAVEQRYWELTVSNCSEQDWSEIVRVAVAAAKDNDGQARQWLSQYLLPKPDTNLISTKFVAALIDSCVRAFQQANRLTDPDERGIAFASAMLDLQQRAVGDVAPFDAITEPDSDTEDA